MYLKIAVDSSSRARGENFLIIRRVKVERRKKVEENDESSERGKRSSL